MKSVQATLHTKKEQLGSEEGWTIAIKVPGYSQDSSGQKIEMRKQHCKYEAFQ